MKTMKTMKTIKNIIVIVLMFASCLSYSQEDGFVNISGKDIKIVDGLYKKHHTSSRKPIPYSQLDEADIAWQKRIWRIIDFRERFNFSLYFPEKKNNNRISLSQLILDGIESGELTAFSPGPLGDMDDFGEMEEMSFAKVKEQFGTSGGEIIQITNADGSITEKKEEAGDINVLEIKQILVKEDWFFDKSKSKIDVRIIGLCPIRMFYKDDDIDQVDLQKKKLFWIYFPEARDLFAMTEAYNKNNDSESLSFDDIFIKRRFSSYIIQKSNVYDNRSVHSFRTGVLAMMESEAVRESIRRLEHDIWSY